MSDHAPDTKNTPTDTPQGDAVDQSRRKLTGAALGAGAVFTLASRPVWANQCTISGMQSGNLSRPQETCEGCTPGYWFECQHLDSWVGYLPSDTFNDVFGVTAYKDPTGKAYTLLDVMGGIHGNMNYGSGGGGGTGGGGGNGGGGTCSLLPNGYVDNPMQRDPISTNLGFHAVAALLNAAHPNVNYGYTAGEVISLFQNSVLNGQGAALKDALNGLNNRGCPLN